MGFLDKVQDTIQTKVKFIAYSDDTETKQIGTPYQVKINPSSITHTKSINYANVDIPQGSSGILGKFNYIEPEKISFEIILDGTGAVGVLNIADDIMKEIGKLEEVIYHYDGEQHEPRFVGILWGDLKFFGRLTNLDYTHTMFKPSGKPLRTKIKMTFVSTQNLSAMAKGLKLSSPDMSHLVTVVAGDTLPAMCERIYRSSKYYLQVAKINNLIDFRNLIPGTQLLFPPIKK